MLYFSVAMATCLANWPWWLRMALVLLVIGHGFLVISTHGVRHHPAAVTVLCQDCDQWRYQLKSGKTYKGRLIKHRSYVSSVLLVLYLRHRRGGRYIVLPRDAVSKHHYRWLAFKLYSSIDTLSHLDLG